MKNAVNYDLFLYDHAETKLVQIKEIISPLSYFVTMVNSSKYQINKILILKCYFFFL